MKLYRIHGREKSWCMPATLLDLCTGDPRCMARGRGTTRCSRLGHEVRERCDGGTGTKGGRLGCPKQGSTLLGGQSRFHYRFTRRGRRVVRYSDDFVALGLLDAI